LLLVVDEGEVVVGLVVVVPIFECKLVVGAGLVQAAALPQRVAQVVVGLSIVWAQLDCFPVGCY